MKKFDQIHETVLKDILDLYDDLKDFSDGELGDLISKHKKTRSITSIARSSNDLICVFPVLASRNVAIDNQAMVSKAIEKNCVAMLQMLFSATQLTNADNAIDYINTFHTNINKTAKSFGLDDVIQISDMINTIGESAIQAGGKIDNRVFAQVKEDMKNINFYLGNDISSKSLAESFTCNLDPSGKFVVQIETRTFNEDTEDDLRNTIAVMGKRNNALRTALKHTEEERNIKNAENQALKRDLNDALKRNKFDAAKAISDARKSSAEYFSKQVVNSEYKKANELMPTLMVINFKSKTGDGYELVDSVVIGVKAKLYPMNSEDIVTHVVSKAKDANIFQKFIKLSTREISFFKDFLFAIDKAKVDALSLSRKGSSNKMWKVLEKRASKSKWNRLMAKSNDATAITTLMMSQNEVDYISKEYHIDITDVYNTRILLEEFNLLGICIVDESLEIAKFMWDTGEDLWETVAFSNLERESNDNTYKKVVNLMTKVM